MTRSRTLAAAVGLALASSLLLGLATGPALARGQHADRWHMLTETNESRVHHDLSDVNLNATLSDLARKHSLAMSRQHRLFHTTDPGSFYLKGIKWSTWGENVGVTSGTTDDLEKAFMASTPHRHNILTGRFRHVAVGAVRVDGLLWVTVFFYG